MSETIDIETASPAEIRRFLRPEPQLRSVTRRSIDGTELGDVDLDPETFGIEPNLAVLHQVVTAQLAAARAGHPVDQDPLGGPGWWRQALPPEGHRPGPGRLQPVAGLGGRWRGARPEARAPTSRRRPRR